ncbi:hypothetical protein M2165_004173 [Variovorax sp. TBS-050B]|uniref:hypothetical protein n=1 Tax=Variovorax sp. TBS-050B TaxID=2940551 RepID=UPI002473B794|nr:hypothetical protein [Variovorax sp. TBS-050B]MDH6594284.1 hypothetical protein [Variovorax sp. TBS-050B]
MGESTTDLRAERKALVEKQDAAKGEATVAGAQYTAALTKNQQVVLDKQAAIAYQNHSYARPGSQEKADAAAVLDIKLAALDNVDRLVDLANKDVTLAKAGLDKQIKDTAKANADADLQTQFQKWKDDVWMWQGIDKKTADKMKAEGQVPTMRMYPDMKQENDAAWEAFVSQQTDMDKYGDDYLTPEERPARNAWLARNRTSDDAVASDLRYNDALSASTRAGTHLTQGDLDRLQQKKDAWIKANPTLFSLNFQGPGEKENQATLDLLQKGVADGKIKDLQIGADRKYTQHLQDMSAADRADPEAMKEADEAYAKDNSDFNVQLKAKIKDLSGQALDDRAQAVDAYIKDWEERNPDLKRKLDALGTDQDQRSLRAAEYRSDQIRSLLSASEQGRQRLSAMDMNYAVKGEYMGVGDNDSAQISKDLEGINQGIEKHTFVRDAWGAMFGDSADEAKDYTEDRLAKSDQLRKDLAAGKISVSKYSTEEDALMDGYDVKSAELAQKVQDADGTWSVVDEAVRMTVTAAAGIAATIASGGNVAVGFGTAMLVSEVWDTTGDVVAAAQGRDIYADGHTSLWTLEGKALTGNASWEDVKFTLKDEAIDAASNIVTATGVGAGIKTSAAVSTRLLAKEAFVKSEGVLNLGGRALVGARAGITSQAVDGVGRVTVESGRVGLDGKWGTEEGNKRIGATFVSSAAGLVSAPLTGGASGAIPLWKVAPAAASSGTTNAAANATTNAAANATTNAAANATTNAAANATTNAAANATTNAAANATTNAAANATTNAAANATTNAAANATTNAAANATTNAAANATTNAAADATTNVAADAVTNVAASATLNAAANATTNAVANATTNAAANATANAAANATANAAANATANAAANATANAAANATANAAANATTNAAANATTNAAANATTNAAANATTNAAANATTDAATNATTSAASSAATSAAANTASSTTAGTQKMSYAGFSGQFVTDGAGSIGTGQLISYLNEGRGMNKGEFIAASLQALPGTLNNIALHPMMAARARAQAGNDAANRQPPPTAGRGTPDVKPVALEPVKIDAPVDALPGLAGRDATTLRVGGVKLDDLTNGLDVQTRASEATAPGGEVEFRVAIDTQKAVASAAEGVAASGAGNTRGRTAGTGKRSSESDNDGGVRRKGDDAQETKDVEAAQDAAIQVRMRAAGFDNVKIARKPGADGQAQPEIVVTGTKPLKAPLSGDTLLRPAYDGYDQRMSYLSGAEMVALYGSGTRPDPVAVAADRAAARSARTDMRLGVTARGRLNVGEYAPLASPTLQSVSTGIGTRSNLRAIATGVMDSIRWRSTVPIRDALGRELSVAVRPDEYRRTSMLQWGVSPMSRDTIFTVFAKDLINTAKTELFGKEGTPGYGVNVRSATDIGPAADGSGRVVELEISVKLDGEKVQLAEGEKDFFGGKASSSPDGHVKVPSSLMFDRVIEDFRIAPLLPIVKKLVGNPLPVTPSVERRSQMLLNDVIGAGDVVPTRFFEQFRKTFGDAKYRVQVVVPDRLPGFGRDPAATAVRNFLAKPDVAGFKALVEHGYVSADPDKALFFVPNRGGNHHRTSVPGKPLTEAFTDLTGKERRVPNKSTSNVWIIFADNGLERTLQRGIYGVKKVVYGALPAGLQRSAPSPHHLVGTGNLIDAMTGGRGRPNADSSRRLTAVAALPTLFDVGVLGTSVEFRVQLGLDAPSAAKSVRKGRMQDFKVSPDDTRTVDVPQWFPKLLERSLTGATPVVPKGGTAQLTTFLDKLQTHLGAEDGAALTALREKHMTGKDAAVGDGKFLRQPVAEDIVSLLVGLKPGAKPGSRPLLAGQPGESAPLAAPAAARTAGMRPADLNYLEGEATVNGRPVPARDIELAVPPDSILVLAERGNPPSAERIAADLRAAGHPEGKDVVLYLCEGATPARADAPVPASLARELSNRLGARVHAVDGDIVLGARTTVDGAPVVQRPNLPLTDVSQKAPHPVAADADFDAQQRFWLAPGGRTQEAQAPFSPKVLDQGAKVGDKSIDPLHLGIEDRVVDMRPMTAQNAREVFPLLVRQMGVSPEYNALGAEGMIDKWLGEIAAGTRYARVIYPAPGSTPVSDAPIGLISVHKEALLGESYRNTLPAALYRGSKPAGETSKEALQARGEVWQFSTYLGSNKNRYPGGVINKAARMQFMKDVMRQEAAKGAPVEAFYSRVSGGAPFITDSNGVTVLLKGHEFNVASSFSQESQTVGRGPIAVGYEDSSPFKSPDYPDGEPARHIYIYETDASLYGPEGKGTLKWRSKIEEAFDKVPGSRSLLSPMRTADKNYLVGEVMVNGRPMPAAEIELAVPPDSILVVAEHGNPPSAERIAADLRAAGHPEGKDVALYLFKGEPSVRPGTPTPEALARELGNLRGSRVHVVDGDVGLGPRNTARGTPVVQRPNLPLTDVSQNAPHPVTDADFDAQKRFWLAPGGRTQEAQAPFSQKVLDQGTAVGDRTIDLAAARHRGPLGGTGAVRRAARTRRAATPDQGVEVQPRLHAAEGRGHDQEMDRSDQRRHAHGLRDLSGFRLGGRAAAAGHHRRAQGTAGRRQLHRDAGPRPLRRREAGRCGQQGGTAAAWRGVAVLDLPDRGPDID